VKKKKKKKLLREESQKKNTSHLQRGDPHETSPKSGARDRPRQDLTSHKESPKKKPQKAENRNAEKKDPHRGNTHIPKTPKGTNHGLQKKK